MSIRFIINLDLQFTIYLHFQISEIKCGVDPALSLRIKNYLAKVAIQPVVDGLDTATPDNPRSLIIDQKLDEFTPSEVYPANNGGFLFSMVAATAFNICIYKCFLTS